MMESTSDIAARFERISGTYDETREPLTAEALDKMADALRNDGSRLILEVGVGTGRIAVPLKARAFDIVGLDISRSMLSRARAKGVSNLVQGDANNPPFRRKVFEATILAHVLQLLEDPARTFRSLTEVTRTTVVAILRKPDPRVDGTQGAREEAHRVFRAAAEELGIPLGPRYLAWHDRYERQEEFLSKFPPDERTTIQEGDRSDALRAYFAAMDPADCRFTSDISQGDFRRVIERVETTLDLNKRVTYRRVDQMLIWRL